MSKGDKPKKKEQQTRGPKPDTLKIKGKWQDAIKRSLTKTKPPEGWPK